MNNNIITYVEKYEQYFNSFPCYTIRINAVREFAWAIPTPKAIKLLRTFTPLIEIGAGTGYWASLIGDTVAFDIEPPPLTYCEVQKGSYEQIQSYPCHTLFLCWPPYDDSLAYNCVKNYKGEYVLYIGEGRGGCTGNDLFHLDLDTYFTQVTGLRLPNWEGIHDSLYVYKRKNMSEMQQKVS